MRCAFCGENRDKTLEHIISKSVLELFPECDITYDEFRQKSYKSEPMIKDVCSVCNNQKLNYIDSYAKDMISKYFIQKYDMDDELEFEYDYIMLLKVLLKYTYNDLRAHRDDTSFFDRNVKKFLLDSEERNLNKKVTILAGLSVKASLVPEFVFGNKKVEWVKNPIFLENSIIMNYDYTTGQVYLRESLGRFNMQDLDFSYMFKFNSGIFIILFWEDNFEKYKEYERLIPLIYPYKVLNLEENATKIQRCTHAYNWNKPYLIDVNWGISMADETNSLIRTDLDPLDIQKELNEEWDKYEKKVIKEHKRRNGGKTKK